MRSGILVALRCTWRLRHPGCVALYLLDYDTSATLHCSWPVAAFWPRCVVLSALRHSGLVALCLARCGILAALRCTWRVGIFSPRCSALTSMRCKNPVSLSFHLQHICLPNEDIFCPVSWLRTPILDQSPQDIRVTYPARTYMHESLGMMC